MSTGITEHSAVGVWKRVIEPESGTMPPAEARVMLTLKLADADIERAELLAGKSREGQLAPGEEHELDSYLTIGSAIEFLKSKARRSLKQAKSFE
jgi:hypothetical protein